jgi:hypothetical protein
MSWLPKNAKLDNYFNFLFCLLKEKVISDIISGKYGTTYVRVGAGSGAGVVIQIYGFPEPEPKATFYVAAKLQALLISNPKDEELANIFRTGFHLHECKYGMSA